MGIPHDHRRDWQKRSKLENHRSATHRTGTLRTTKTAGLSRRLQKRYETRQHRTEVSHVGSTASGSQSVNRRQRLRCTPCGKNRDLKIRNFRTIPELLRYWNGFKASPVLVEQHSQRTRGAVLQDKGRASNNRRLRPAGNSLQRTSNPAKSRQRHPRSRQSDWTKSTNRHVKRSGNLLPARHNPEHR